MRHVYECPMRWADLDLLGHVNNVVYVDYLQEARVDLMRVMFPDRPDDLAEGVVVVRHEVTYLATLEFSFRPVKIECWVTNVRTASFTMAYEIFQDDDSVEGGRRVYLRATTLLTPYVFEHERPRRLTVEEREVLDGFREDPLPGTAKIAPLEHAGARHYALQVRFSDVDVYRHVNNVKYFEYLQESRVRLMADMTRDAEGLPPMHFVVAQTDVDYRAPILFRREPYDVWSAIIRLGTRSMTIESEICDGDRLLARARVVTVFYDLANGRSVEPDPAYRELLSAHLP